MQGCFRDRRAAGAELAVQLTAYRKVAGLLVLGLPRGGVPVAYEVARALGAEFDVLVVRKLGVPQQPELALGAVASGGAVVFNDDVVGAIGLTRTHLDAIVRAETAELHRRERTYRGEREPLNVRGRTVIVVDDGLATGASMRAAVTALRSLRPAKVVVAVPVAPVEAAEEFAYIADDFVCIETPRDFHSVGWWYRNFDQTQDDEVHALLGAIPRVRPSAA
jgi:putative phosphoribosyl transferase